MEPLCVKCEPDHERVHLRLNLGVSTIVEMIDLENLCENSLEREIK